MVTQLRAEIELDGAPPAAAPADVLVGGTNSAFRLPFTGCIERAAGTQIWDESGRSYVDFLLASGPLILGHCHPAVMEAVSAQLTQGTAYYAVNRPAVELAQRLVEIPGCTELVRFASSGTEATLHAVRLARAYTGRDKVLVFSRAYHGSHDVSIVGHSGAVKAQSGGVPARVVEDVLVARFNDIDSVESVFQAYPGQVAAVLIEPQQRSIDPAPGFLEQLRRIGHSNGAVLIFDEVLTGFRLAYGGAQERYGVQPDMVCYGKIVGGGFPLSAVGGRREIMSLADPARASTSGFVHFSGTLSGNPVSAGAGLATLAELREPGVYAKLYALGDRLRRLLNEALAAAGTAGCAIGSGPIAAIEFDENEPGDAGRLKQEINRHMIRRGILVQLQTRFYISLLHTEDEIDLAAEAFADSLKAVRGSFGLRP